MSNEGFRFKQFFVRHDLCAMKVGTDGVLLGAWAPTRSAITATDAENGIKGGNASALPTTTHVVSGTPIYKILDVGTGCGLIALMLAQRCAEAQIDAIDIDEAAYMQARDNFAVSPWTDRLHATQCALQEWEGKDYDLIVSNPPYFVNSLKNPDARRCMARHTDSLPFDELMSESTKRLAPDGILSIIAPIEAEQLLIGLAEENQLTCIKNCKVHSKPGFPTKRVLYAWQHSASGNSFAPYEKLILENEHGGRSEAYQQLTKDFYL